MVKVLKIEVYEKKTSETIYRREGTTKIVVNKGEPLTTIVDELDIEFSDKIKLKSFKKHLKNMYFKGNKIDISYKEK